MWSRCSKERNSSNLCFESKYMNLKLFFIYYKYSLVFHVWNVLCSIWLSIEYVTNFVKSALCNGDNNQCWTAGISVTCRDLSKSVLYLNWTNTIWFRPSSTKTPSMKIPENSKPFIQYPLSLPPASASSNSFSTG